MSKKLKLEFIKPPNKATKFSEVYSAIDKLFGDDSKQGIRIVCDNEEQMRSLFNMIYLKYPQLNIKTVIAEKAVLVWRKPE